MVLAPQAASRLPRIPLNCEGKVRGSRPPKEKINTMASDEYGADNPTPAGQLRSMGQVHGLSERVPRMGGLALRQRSRAVQCDYQYRAQRVPPRLTPPSRRRFPQGKALETLQRNTRLYLDGLMHRPEHSDCVGIEPQRESHTRHFLGCRGSEPPGGRCNRRAKCRTGRELPRCGRLEAIAPTSA